MEEDSLASLLLAHYLADGDGNPYVTYETQVLRILKQLTEEQFRLSWTGVLETVKGNTCVLNADLHRLLHTMWKQRSRLATVEDQHCMERVMGRDYVKPNDLLKVASILSKVLVDKKPLYQFFACDGFLGSDWKMYVEGFRGGDEHVVAVRELYEREEIKTPRDVRKVLKSIFRGEENVYSERYAEVVGRVKEMGEVRKMAREKWKRKMTEGRKGGKRKVEEDAVSVVCEPDVGEMMSSIPAV